MKNDEVGDYLLINPSILKLTRSSDYSLFIAIVHYRGKSKKQYCSATNEWISEYLQISMMSVNRMIKELKEMDLIQADKTTNHGKVERRITLTEKCKQLYKITKDKMENLDDSIFSDKPIEQKPLKGKSLIIPGDSNIGKDEEDFNKLRANYFQPKIYNKKKELKAYLELTPKDRITAYQNLKDYLELNKDNQQYIVSLQNYLLDRKFSDENIEYLKKVKKKPNKESDNAPIKDNQWEDFK